MPMSKAHNRASAKWNASRDNIMIRPEIPEGTRIREEAAKAGVSIQNYILEAVRRRMESEAPAQAAETPTERVSTSGGVSVLPTLEGRENAAL